MPSSDPGDLVGLKRAMGLGLMHGPIALLTGWCVYAFDHMGASEYSVWSLGIGLLSMTLMHFGAELYHQSKSPSPPSSQEK